MNKVILILALVVLIAVPGNAFADTESSWRGLGELGTQLTFRDPLYSATQGTSLWELAPLLAGLNPSVCYTRIWDFSDGTVDSTVFWQFTADVATHTKAVADSATGVLLLEAKTTDNNEVYMYGRGEPIRCAADNPWWFEAKVRVLAVADSTYADNAVVGIMAAGGANMMQDNGAGPPANYTGAVFFIPDQPGTGSTYWHTESATTTNIETTASVLARVAATWYTLGIIWDGEDTLYFFINGALEATHSTRYPPDSATLTPIVGVKTGAAATTSMEVDYIAFMQVR